MTANVRVTVRPRVAADPLPGLPALLAALDGMSDDEAGEAWRELARRYLARIGDRPTATMIGRAVNIARTGRRPTVDEVEG